jgi:regulator of protease activity HflC (stomatin/prohibitin superfamily)
VHKYRFDIHHKISVDEDAVTRTAIAIVTAKIEAEKRTNAERDAIKEARRREEEERKNNAQIEKERREAAQKEKEERIKLIAKGFADPAEALRFLDNPDANEGKVGVIDSRSILGKILGTKKKEKFVLRVK